VPDKLHGSPFHARNTTRARCLTRATALWPAPPARHRAV